MSCIFGVQNLIVKLDFILEALFATIELLDSLLLVPIDANFGLLRLESPTLLIVNHGLSHPSFLGDRHLMCVNWYVATLVCYEEGWGVVGAHRTGSFINFRARLRTSFFERNWFCQLQNILLILARAWHALDICLESITSTYTKRHRTVVPRDISFLVRKRLSCRIIYSRRHGWNVLFILDVAFFVVIKPFSGIARCPEHFYVFNKINYLYIIN